MVFVRKDALAIVSYSTGMSLANILILIDRQLLSAQTKITVL
jgi:hypothetical protein